MTEQDRTPDRFGPYRVRERIGEGGMGVVYLAADAEQRAVAVKALRPAVAGDPIARRRLAREVETMRCVRSPFVAEVLDADVTCEPPYIVTRYVRGRTLEQVVTEHGPLRGQELATVGRGLAAALTAVHAAGVVHRDLKPGNVMLAGGEPVVIDFGIAHLQDSTRITQTGMFMGTPGYLAPEVIEGEDSRQASDVHSWGATMAFAATGRPPFGSGTFETIFYRIVQGQPDLDGCPPPLLPVVAAALARDPARRPAAAELNRRVAALVPALLAADPAPVTGPGAVPGGWPQPAGAAGPAAAADPAGAVVAVPPTVGDWVASAGSGNGASAQSGGVAAAGLAAAGLAEADNAAAAAAAMPGSAAPGSAAPGTALPGSAAADAGILGAGVSGAGFQGGGPPGGAVPGSAGSDAGILGAAAPVAGVPVAGAPGAPIPGSAAADAGILGAGVSGSGVPGSGVPGSAVPGTGLPGIGLPWTGTEASGQPGSREPGWLPASGGPGTGSPAVARPHVTQPLAIGNPAGPSIGDLLPAVRYGPAGVPPGNGQTAVGGGYPGAAGRADARPVRRRTRPLFVLAMVLVGVSASVILPVAGTLGALAALVSLRAADLTQGRLARRRAAHGPRPSDPAVTALTYPLMLAWAAAGGLLLAPLALVAAGIAAGITIVAVPVDPFPRAVAYGAGALVACYGLGPGSAGARRQLGKLFDTVGRTPSAAVVALVGVSALALAGIVTAASQPAFYWPLHHFDSPHSNLQALRIAAHDARIAIVRLASRVVG
jgi:predicted Ser/Thr protein kinase